MVSGPPRVSVTVYPLASIYSLYQGKIRYTFTVIDAHSQTRLNILFTGNKQMQSLYCGSLVNGIGFQITEWLGIDTGI